MVEIRMAGRQPGCVDIAGRGSGTFWGAGWLDTGNAADAESRLGTHAAVGPQNAKWALYSHYVVGCRTKV